MLKTLTQKRTSIFNQIKSNQMFHFKLLAKRVIKSIFSLSVCKIFGRYKTFTFYDFCQSFFVWHFSFWYWIKTESKKLQEVVGRGLGRSQVGWIPPVLDFIWIIVISLCTINLITFLPININEGFCVSYDQRRLNVTFILADVTSYLLLNSNNWIAKVRQQE